VSEEQQPAFRSQSSNLLEDLPRRRFLLGSAGAATGLAMGGFLGGCSSSTTSGGGATSTGKKGATSVSLLLDFLPNVDDVFVAVAQKYGYFAEEGLTVTTANPSVAQINLIPELVGLGRFDFGIQSVPVGLFARAAGSPVLAVAGFGKRSEGIIWLAPNNVTGPASLVGRTVATYDAADYKAFMISFMRSAGMSTSQVNLVNSDFTPPLIAAGKVYAGLGIRWGEFIDTESAAKKTPRFLSFFEPDIYGIPQMNYLLIFTSESFAEKNPDVVTGMIRALARGYKKAILLPGAELSPIMNSWASTGPNATGDLPTNMRKFETGRPYYFFGPDEDPNTASYFQQPLDTVAAVAAWLRDTGVAPIPHLSSFATNEFITPGALHPSV
jgi:ABC-type nitrate/sulfonate/bicarbonate transport system substrate-binding protein